MSEDAATLRALLSDSFDKAETEDAGVTAVASESVVSAEPSAEQRARDEAGRFAAKGVQPATIPGDQPAPVEVQPRPTHWKKDFVPLWEKLYNGQHATMTAEEARKVAEYAGIQRESEFATGVSTYKQEAQAARELQTALAPFMPELQQHNIKPTEWISNLGNAHRMLALGSPEQKLQAFAKLAQDYGVPLAAVGQQQQGQVAPEIAQLMGIIQPLQQQVQGFNSWREQQEQQRASQAIAELAGDAANYPHFEKVKGMMGQLLGNQMASDLKSAYKLACRLDDDVAQEIEQARASQPATLQQRAQQAVKAKANVIGVKSATPSGSGTVTAAKDRRSTLAEAFGGVEGRV